MNTSVITHAPAQYSPAECWLNLPAELRERPQWALAGPDKRPRTVGGAPASSTDPTTWADFDTACAAAAAFGDQWQVGYMLHQDDPFCCIDLDVKPDTAPNDRARFERIIATMDSYTERSRSGLGWHVWVRANIGTGRRRDGVEVYSQERFIICTGDVAHPLSIAERQGVIDGMISQMAPPAPEIALTGPDTPDLAAVARAEADSGEMGRLWRGDWQGRYGSKSAADLALVKFLLALTGSPRECWATFRLSSLGQREKAARADYARGTLAVANQHLEKDAYHIRCGREAWESMCRNIQDAPASTVDDPSASFTLEFAMTTDTATLKLDYLLDPWLPLRCVVGFFGRGSTAKSSFLASMAAAISKNASTLWISVEEPDDWIKVRHIRCGGADQTLAVVKAIESKRDREGRVVASSFNVLTDLEPAITQARQALAERERPPLRLVVLDTAVGLTRWGKGESPNDDAAVKKLLAHLQAWAERHNLTIAIIGHANKGTHEHLADTVMGAAAWTNSPRLSFIHAADHREDHTYVVRTAKTNFEAFGAPYRTAAVHTLYEREGGPDTVLVKVEPEPIVWGSVDSMEMFKDATKVPRGEEKGDGPMPSNPTVPELVVRALVEAVMEAAPGEYVTREHVEQRYGKPIDRSRWQKVEQHLMGHPIVNIERGEKNRAMYRRLL